MKVTYDHQIFSVQRYGGVSRYFAEIARRLARRPECTVQVMAFAHVNKYLSSLPAAAVLGFRVPQLPRTDRLRQRADDVASCIALRIASPDLIHETYYSTRRLAPNDTPTIVTVYDMIHERLPEYFPDADIMSRRKKAAVERASHVICISESTRTDLLEFFALGPEKVSVVHLASSLQPACAVARAGDEATQSRYLLFVGHRNGYKNFARLLEALTLIPSFLRPIRLILFGGSPLTLYERQTISGLANSEVTVEHRNGGDDELAKLYAGAAAFVYPSLYEGFGIPILEAMTCGCPVICGNTSSTAEVAGDAAELCDTSSPAALANAITAVLGSRERASELSRLGTARSALFSWDRCADETFSIYERVVSEHSTNP